MASIDNLERNIWDILNGIRRTGERVTLTSFTEAVQKSDPNILYSSYKEMTKEYGRYMGMSVNPPVLPDAFSWLMKAFADKKQKSKALVPFATGLEFDLFGEEAEYRFFDKDYENATKIIVNNINTIEEMPSTGSYDLISAALPLGPVNSTFISGQIVEQCVDLLSDSGYCIFTFGKMITLGSSSKWLAGLEARGLYCNAIIDMPMGSYAPMTMVDTVIAIFSKNKTDKLFAALLSDESCAEKIVDNFLSNKVSSNGPKLGVYVEGDVRCYSDFINISRVKNKNKSLAKAYNGQSIKVSEIGTVHAPDKNDEFQECENAVYIPKLGNSPVVTDVADFHIKAQNYFQIVVDTEKILPRYLAFFFNTEEGLNLRQLSYRGTTIKAFNTKLIGDMEIPCPSLELQSEYLKTYEQLEKLRVEIETLKDRLQKTPASYKNIRKEMKDINNNGDKFAQWIESLPYPIATILKRYSVSDDPTKKQETLFYFFEAYAIFEATLISAALNKNLIDCSALGDVDPSYFEKASFGNWVRMDRALSNLFLDLINNSNEEQTKIALECFKTTDENLIKLLCNRNACNILDNAAKNRNSWKGHSGITSDALYMEHVEILDSQLRKLQESIKDLYERVRLIRPLTLSFSNGVFSNKVEVLTGSNPIFTKETIESVTPLDNSKLYLQMIDTGEVLELPPYFILKNSPADAKNACYFYSRVESGSTRYVSYHYDGRPEDMESGVAAFDSIKALLSK